MSREALALAAARDAATNLTRAVLEALQRGGEPARTIDLARKPVGPLAARRVGCPISGGPCDPTLARVEGTVTVQDLANALRCAQELLLLMDHGLESPVVPHDVVEQIEHITGPIG